MGFLRSVHAAAGSNGKECHESEVTLERGHTRVHSKSWVQAEQAGCNVLWSNMLPLGTTAVDSRSRLCITAITAFAQQTCGMHGYFGRHQIYLWPDRPMCREGKAMCCAAACQGCTVQEHNMCVAQGPLCKPGGAAVHVQPVHVQAWPGCPSWQVC